VAVPATVNNFSVAILYCLSKLPKIYYGL